MNHEQNLRLARIALAEAADRLAAEINVQAKAEVAKLVTTPLGFCFSSGGFKLFVDFTEI